MPNPRRQDRELDALYATLPKLECQGYCHDSCGPISMSVRERARIVERARKPITCGKGASCSMLTAERRCSVYEIRPVICRLWGLVQSMPCPYGCRPEGGLLPDTEGTRLIIEADRIGGAEDNRLHQAAKQIIEALSEEELAELIAPMYRGARATLEGRVQTMQRTGLRAPFERRGLLVGDDAIAFPEEEQ